MGPNVKRLERLIHLHLADLVMYGQHRHPRFPNVSFEEAGQSPSPGPSRKNSDGDSPGRRAKKRSALQQIQALSQPCPDCSKTHKEIFTVFRGPRGSNIEGKEFEALVGPIIIKWGDFVGKFV